MYEYRGLPGALLTTPILGAMLGDAPIRMLTGGQELTVEYDEKSLAEVQLKDNQVRAIRPSTVVCSCGHS